MVTSQPTSRPQSTCAPEDLKTGRISLASLLTGESGTVLDLPENNEYRGQLMGMGLLPGATIRVVQHRRDSSRPLVLATGQTRIAMGEEIAAAIMVEKNRAMPEGK
ncbi:MAG: FeoA family protein [Planctomycetia bacterium]|nr:FeoA family protein [Planctomycetia bacterium]